MSSTCYELLLHIFQTIDHLFEFSKIKHSFRDFILLITSEPTHSK